MSEPFSTPLRVRFGETDAMGVANNAAYLQYFEIGRIEFLRAHGRSYAEVHDGGIDMVVIEASLRYLRPLLFDDEFSVECRLERAVAGVVPVRLPAAARRPRGRQRLHPPRLRRPIDAAAGAGAGLAG